MFSDRLRLAEIYAGLLVDAGVERGLLGPREAPRVWERHLLNCAVVEELCPRGSSVADVGSGAGLPGLAIAIARPDLTVRLMEPLQRRVDFLREAVGVLGLDGQVSIFHGRAEEVPERTGERFDRVASRAVAPLSRLARWCVPLLGDGGEMIAIKGESAREELSAAQPELKRLGIVSASVETVGTGRLRQPTTVIRLRGGSG